MSLDLGTMYVLVSLEDGEYKQKLNKLEDTSTNAFQNIAKAAAAYLTLRTISSFVQGTVNMFSDLEEETNKFNVVFAGLGNETSKILAEMRKDFGLSELSAKRMLAGTGDMLTGFGFDPKLALVLSEGAAKLGADIASFSNYAGGAAGATTALTKAMLGETESAKMLGVVIKQDSEEYKNLIEQVMTTGIKIKALGDENIIVHTQQQAKAVAALALAYQQSPNAIGDFKRSSDSIANQTRILENNFEELSSKIGGDLAPAYRDALTLSNKLVSAYNSLNPQTRILINNTVALAAAAMLLGKAKLSVVGFTTAVKAAGVAMKSFWVDIGPWGWAILAIGGILSIAQAKQRQYTAELEASTQSAQSAVDAAKKLSAAHKEQANTANDNLKRLKELSEYERLSNAEKEEAEALVKSLTDLYGNLGVSVDKATGKISIATGAFSQMNDKQRQLTSKDVLKEYNALTALIISKGNELHNETSDLISSSPFNRVIINPLLRSLSSRPDWQEDMDSQLYSSTQNDIAAAQKLVKVQEQIYAFEKIHRNLVKEGDNEEAQKTLEIIKLLKKQLDLEKQMDELRSKEKGGQEQINKEKLAANNKKIRDAMDSLAGVEWDIRFNASDVARQVDMLNAEIQQVFSRQSGKYNTIEAFVSADRHAMTEQEIKDLQTIIELEARRADLKKQSVNYFQQEQQSYMDELRQQERRNKESKIEKEIRKAEQGGNGEQARAIMERELAAARLAAKNTETAYRKALALARKDELATEAERKRVAELKRKWQESLSDQNKWQNRIDTQSEDRQRDVTKAVGSFSLQLLASQLGGPNKPEVETAKNTKRTKELLEQINENIGKTQVYK